MFFSPFQTFPGSHVFRKGFFFLLFDPMTEKMKIETPSILVLGGAGFKHFLFSCLFREDEPILTTIFFRWVVQPPSSTLMVEVWILNWAVHIAMSLHELVCVYSLYYTCTLQSKYFLIYNIHNIYIPEPPFGTQKLVPLYFCSFQFFMLVSKGEKKRCTSFWVQIVVQKLMHMYR